MRSGRAKRKRTILMAVVNFAMPLAKLWIGGSRTILNAKTTTPMDLFDFLDEKLNFDIIVQLFIQKVEEVPRCMPLRVQNSPAATDPELRQRHRKVHDSHQDRPFPLGSSASHRGGFVIEMHPADRRQPRDRTFSA